MAEPASDVDPRVVLAEERTFLAWHRTSLALTAGAVALAGLAQASGSDVGPRLLAIAMVVFAGGIALLNDRRHRDAQAAIQQRAPLPPSRLPVILTFGVVTITAVALLLIATGLELR